MSSLVTDFDYLFTTLETFKQLWNTSAQVPDNLATIPSRSATSNLGLNEPIQQIDWDKYGEEISAEYREVKNIFLEGYDLESRKIGNLSSLNEFLRRLQEFIEKYWQDLTYYDKRTLEIVAQEILKSSEFFTRVNWSNFSQFWLFAFLWALFKKMVQNRDKPHSLFNFRRLKTLMANRKLIAANTTASPNETMRAMVAMFNTLMDWSNTIVRLAQQERESEGEPRLYETATPEEWCRAFDEWSDTHPINHHPPLSDEALSRESIYGDLV